MVAVIRVGQPGSPSKRTSSRMAPESAAWSKWAIRVSICCCSSGDRAWSKQSPIRIVPRSTVIGTAPGDHPEDPVGRRNRQNAIQAVPDRPELIRVPLVGKSPRTGLHLLIPAPAVIDAPCSTMPGGVSSSRNNIRTTSFREMMGDSA